MIYSGHLKQIALLLLMLFALVILFGLGNKNKQSEDIELNRSALTIKFQTQLEKLRAQYDLPGITAAYALADGTAQSVAVGYANIATKQAMTTDSRMLAASIGKSFVAATVLALAQENKLALNEPIKTWFADKPWFASLANHDTITVQHLLNHTSGLVDHVHQAEFAPLFQQAIAPNSFEFNPEAIIESILEQPPLFEAGKAWSYTDTGYILLGLIIEDVSGNDYYEEVERRFLKPLDLNLTTPSNQRKLPGIANGYLASDNAFGLPETTLNENGLMNFDPSIEWTGGGLISHPKDLVRWAKVLFTGQAMQGDYRRDLLNSVPTEAGAEHIRYGAGTSIYTATPLGPSYGHAGWIPGYTSSLRYYPDHDIAIAFQINTDIGIMDGTKQVYGELETTLSQLVVAEVDEFTQTSVKD